MDTLDSRMRRIGCRCLGCLLLILATVIAACALLFALVFRWVNPASAAPLAAASRHTVVLVDQSASVVNAPAAQTLAREATLRVLERLRRQASPGDTLQVNAFGARTIEIIPPTGALDDALLERVRTAFEESQSLGATPAAEALAGILEGRQPPTDLILITDGLPDTDAIRTQTGRSAYVDQLRQVGARFARAGIRVSILLIGLADRTAWLPVWSDIARQTGGVLADIPSTAEIEPAVATLPLSPPSPAPSPPPAPTPAPTATTPPTLRPTAQPAPSPAPTQDMSPASASAAWLWLLIGLALVAGVTAVVAWTRSRRARREPAARLPFDLGVLEVSDPQRDTTQRIELSQMALGEVWGIGSRPTCHIRLDEVAGDQELAVLVMTPDGPHIESRGAPMWLDGQRIHKHLLFDGDDIYLDRFVLNYQNFFRRRGVSLLDDDSPTSNLQPPTSNFQPQENGDENPTQSDAARARQR
jgi:hypothetical protein